MAKAKYTKPALSIADQISHLENRGMVIADKSKAEHYLSNISYYRFSAYLYPYRILPLDDYVSGTTFEDVLDTYLFDREFRLLIFDAIERVEIAFRTQLIYQPSILKGPFWFKDKSNIIDVSRWQTQLSKLQDEINRSGEIFIGHFFNKYDGNTPPAWMSFEVVSLGLLSMFYHNLRFSSPAKKAISLHFGLTEPRVFQSWIRSLTYVRNICAHHSRLWNRTLTTTPKIILKPAKLWISIPTANHDKIYYFLCCLWYMLREVNPESSFVKKLKDLFVKYPNIDSRSMGFPVDWKSDLFWS